MVIDGVATPYLAASGGDSPLYRKRINAVGSVDVTVVSTIAPDPAINPAVDKALNVQFTPDGGTATAVFRGYAKVVTRDRARKTWRLTGSELPVKLQSRELTRRAWYGTSAPAGTLTATGTTPSGITTEAGVIKNLLDFAGISYSATSILSGGTGNAIDQHRVDFTSPLTAIAELANVFARDWWMQKDAGVDTFYYGARTGSAVTYKLGEDVFANEDLKDDRDVKNSILALGAFDGAAQVGQAATRSVDAPSQTTYGTREGNVPVRSLVSDSLRSTAQASFLAGRKDERRTVRLMLMRQNPETKDSLDIGSSVTVKDYDGVTDVAVLKCVAIEGNGRWSVIELGKLDEPFLTDLSELDTSLTTEQTTSQGGQSWNSAPVADNAGPTRPLEVPFFIPSTTRENLKAAVSVVAHTVHADQVSTIFKTNTLTAQGQGETELTDAGGLPASDYGYVLYAEVTPNGLASPAVVEAYLIMGVIDAGGLSVFDLPHVEGRHVSVWNPISGTAATLRVVLAMSKAGRKVKLKISNGFPAGQTWDIKWYLAKAVAAVAGGESAGTATVDLYLYPPGVVPDYTALDATRRFATAQAIPTAGAEVAITIGSGAGQLGATSTGTYRVLVVPTTEVHLHGQVQVQSQIQVI